MFQEYIEKEKGINLDAYSMQELIAIVNRFKGKDMGETEMEGISRLEEESKVEVLGVRQDEKEELEKNEKLGKMEESFLQADNKKSDSFNTSTKVYHQLLKKNTVSKLYKRIFEARETIRVKIRSYSK